MANGINDVALYTALGGAGNADRLVVGDVYPIGFVLSTGANTAPLNFHLITRVHAYTRLCNLTINGHHTFLNMAVGFTA